MEKIDKNKNIEDNKDNESLEEINAQLNIDLDVEKSNNKELQSKIDELTLKYEDTKKANNRLIKRISQKEEIEEDSKSVPKMTKITDLYDFKSGKLSLKK